MRPGLQGWAEDGMFPLTTTRCESADTGSPGFFL